VRFSSGENGDVVYLYYGGLGGKILKKNGGNAEYGGCGSSCGEIPFLFIYLFH
jgi:hypothetical protein